MERSDVQRDPDVQMLSVLGVANACMNMAATTLQHGSLDNPVQQACMM